MQAWAAPMGQRAQRVTSPQGLGHLETLHRMGGGALTQLLARGPGAGSQPGGKNGEKHQNRHKPRGRAGERALMEVALLGCHGRRAAGKSIPAWPEPADPIDSAPGLCQIRLLKF